MAARDDFDAWCQQSITDVLDTLVKHHGRDMVLGVLGGEKLSLCDDPMCGCGKRKWMFADTTLPKPPRNPSDGTARYVQ